MGAQRIEVGGHAAWAHDEGDPSGTFHTFDALALPGEAPRKVHVLVPRGPGVARCPLVVVNDGQTTFFPGGPGGKSLRVARTLSALQAEGALPPMVVAAVHARDREQEYLHVPVQAPWLPPFDVRRGVGGGLPEHTRFLAGPLLDFLRAHYPVRDDALGTAVVGASHGGLAAFHTAATRGDRFGLGGALSPSIWVGADGPLKTSLLWRAVREPLLRHRPRLWIDWGRWRPPEPGREEYCAPRARELVEVLEREAGYARGRELFVHVDPIGFHDEDAWAHRVGLLLRAFFGVASPA